jgi:hypothetical protein
MSVPPLRMRSLWINDIQEDFVFVVGARHYSVPWMMSHFLFPRVGILRSADPSVTEYVFETEDLANQFDLFLSLVHGSTVRLDQTNSQFLLALSRELVNPNLYLFLTISTILPQSLDSDFFDFSPERAIAAISSHFSELDRSTIDQIPLSVLYPILSHDSLQISSEDSLYSYICSRLSVNSDYSEFFALVKFDHLTIDCISSFESLLSNHSWVMSHSI